MELIYIGIGGFFGAIARFLAASSLQKLLGPSFPYGTLFVNVFGSFFLCLFLPLSIETYNISPELRAAITVGFCGAFTTFSTFSYETLSLFQDGYHLMAFLNIGGNFLLCLTSGWLGFVVSRILS